MPFKINANDIIYATTTRGVNAYAPIRDAADLLVGRIDDKAEAIVAPVHFDKPEVRAAFLAEARAKGFAEASDDYAISEYARRLLTDAEDAYLDNLSK